MIAQMGGQKYYKFAVKHNVYFADRGAWQGVKKS